MRSLLVLSVVTLGSLASANYSSKMSCAKVQEIVATKGAAIIYQTPYIYDRYVSSGAECLVGEITKPAFVVAKDTKSCFVGYTCDMNSSLSGY